MLLDHVTAAGPDLGRLRGVFARAGIPTEYGGAHSNGITHMALAGFADGSYLELISTLEPGQESPWWPRQIARNAGPCAWCARADQLATECARLASLGIPVRGPVPYSRVRADGTLIEWNLAFPGPGDPGAILPFLIQDVTARVLRVQPSRDLADTGLSGVAAVVIAVGDLAWYTQLFERVYGWRNRETRPDAAFGATVVKFAGAPVALAAPLSPASWLARRLMAFGEAPAAFLLSASDLVRAGRHFATAVRGTWLNQPALWLDIPRGSGTHIGIIEEAA